MIVGYFNFLKNKVQKNKASFLFLESSGQKKAQPETIELFQNIGRFFVKIRQNLGCKPRIFLHPNLISRRRVDERKILWQKVLVVFYDVRQFLRAFQIKIMLDRIASDEQSQLNIRHGAEQTGMPFGGKALARRQITRLASSGEIKVHRQNGDFA